MANLSLPTMQSVIRGMVAAVQSSCAAFLDFSVGSDGLAILEGSAAQWSVQQNNIYSVLKASRLSTSSGADVDSFVGDYGMTRIDATGATGSVTVSRFASVGSATLAISTLFLSSDGSQRFSVGIDTSNPLYQAAAGGYVLPQGVNSVTVPIVAITPGPDGNVVGGAISLFGQATAGLDVVTNALALNNGAPAETDQSLKNRFALYIQSLERGTKEAIESAIAGVQTGLTYLVLAGVDAANNPTPGRSIAFVDDGSGFPPNNVLQSVQVAVDRVRALGEQVSIIAPTVLPVSIGMTLTVQPGANKAALFAPVSAALSAFVDALPIGAELSVTKLANVAYEVDARIVNVTFVTINTHPFDLILTPGQVAKLGMSPVVS